MMSMKVWNKFTPEQQKLLQESAQAAAEYNRKLDNDNAAQWLQLLKDKGMQVTEPDIAAFRKAVEPVYRKYEAQFGKDLIKAILETK